MLYFICCYIIVGCYILTIIEKAEPMGKFFNAFERFRVLLIYPRVVKMLVEQFTSDEDQKLKAIATLCTEIADLKRAHDLAKDMLHQSYFEADNLRRNETELRRIITQLNAKNF